LDLAEDQEDRDGKGMNEKDAEKRQDMTRYHNVEGIEESITDMRYFYTWVQGASGRLRIKEDKS